MSFCRGFATFFFARNWKFFQDDFFKVSQKVSKVLKAQGARWQCPRGTCDWEVDDYAYDAFLFGGFQDVLPLGLPPLGPLDVPAPAACACLAPSSPSGPPRCSGSTFPLRHFSPYPPTVGASMLAKQWPPIEGEPSGPAQPGPAQPAVQQAQHGPARGRWTYPQGVWPSLTRSGLVQ